MAFEIRYGSMTQLTCRDIPGGRLGYSSIASILFTEPELRDLFREWLRQRAIYRRQIKFLDPGMT